MLSEHVRWVSEQIDDDDLAKLAILTWNFDASSQLPPSQQLFCFLARPHDEVDAFYSVLHTSYNNLIEGIQQTGHLNKNLRNFLGSSKIVWKMNGMYGNACPWNNQLSHHVQYHLGIC